MGRQLDYDIAANLLQQAFAIAERAFDRHVPPGIAPELIEHFDRLFLSNAQSTREVLVGCVIAKILDPDIDVTEAYMNLGDDAFNGRDLDQRVVNPFLRERGVPVTKGPYLAMFRRSVRFIPETRRGVRDKRAFDSFLAILDALAIADEDEASALLGRLLYGFVALREATNIQLADVRRLSLDQYETLITGLLPLQTGGRLPVLLAVAAFQALNECFELGWQIEWQGINVADRAHDVGGDITVSRGRDVLFAVEVTEREIDRDRIISTFVTKIAQNGLDDYIFFFTARPPTPEARGQARQYFAQGHEINLIPVGDWIITVLSTIGPRCRRLFTERLLELLSGPDVPTMLKVAWNDAINALMAA